MKLETLDEKYLRGIIDGKIADYSCNCNSIPEELNLMYSVQYKLNGEWFEKVTPIPNSAKITFHWIEDGEWVMVDSDTDSREYKGRNGFDHFTILAGERVVKLQMYVEETLDRLTK